MPLEFVVDYDLNKLEKIKDNFKWFYSNYSHFKKHYSYKHVAIRDNRVIDCDKSLDVLINRLQIRDYNDSIAIEFVYP